MAPTKEVRKCLRFSAPRATLSQLGIGISGSIPQLPHPALYIEVPQEVPEGERWWQTEKWLPRISLPDSQILRLYHIQGIKELCWWDQDRDFEVGRPSWIIQVNLMFYKESSWGKGGGRTVSIKKRLEEVKSFLDEVKSLQSWRVEEEAPDTKVLDLKVEEEAPDQTMWADEERYTSLETPERNATQLTLGFPGSCHHALGLSE